MENKVTTEDYIAISDHMGRYCWAVDEGKADEWAAMWTEDGTFSGVTPQPLVGHGALKMIPEMSFKESGGKLRHMFGNLYCDYGANKDTVIGHFYNFVSNWANGGSFRVMAVCEAIFVRDGKGWKVKRNDVKMLTG